MSETENKTKLSSLEILFWKIFGLMGVYLEIHYYYLSEIIGHLPLECTFNLFGGFILFLTFERFRGREDPDCNWVVLFCAITLVIVPMLLGYIEYFLINMGVLHSDPVNYIREMTHWNSGRIRMI